MVLLLLSGPLALDNHPVSRVVQTKIPIVQENLCADKYKNFMSSTHHFKIRQAMYVRSNIVAPSRNLYTSTAVIAR
jgi:hypothetical protein